MQPIILGFASNGL